jgi:predicted Zn-ribbon and HTH transcriptional regulator
MIEKKFTSHACNRCHHKWLGKSAEKPNVCPRCKSVYWNREKKLHYDWHAAHKKLVKV